MHTAMAPRLRSDEFPKSLRLETTIIDNHVTGRTEKEVINRIKEYIDKYTDNKFYIGITSGITVTGAFKRRLRRHDAQKKHELYEMHCVYETASNYLIRKLEASMIDIYIDHANNVNKIRGAKKMAAEAVISAKANSYLYLLTL
jgi:metal-dependent hydrolase (beta-lactamase superfamily II)